MTPRRWYWVLFPLPVLLLMAGIACSTGSPPPSGDGSTGALRSTSYDDLVSFFRGWREFQPPKVVDGVPDYTRAAMTAQRAGFADFERRLAAIDPGTWPVPQRVDYETVRAELRGFEFDHRVLRPWSRDPCFYTVITGSPPDVPAREGPELYGTLMVPELPLPEADLPAFRVKLRAIPAILDQAKQNLVEDAKDLYTLGIRVKQKESAILANLADSLRAHHPDLVPDAERAAAAVDDFRTWLEERRAGMTAPSGIGIENFNQYMRQVHLVPFDWHQQMAILQRELTRAWASLKLEESRNRNLPRLERVATEAEYHRRHEEAAREIVEFLRREKILTVPEYLSAYYDPGGFIPPGGTVGFFLQIEYRHSLPMKCHATHTFDRLREARNTHPIRSVPLLYNIWDGRAEGLATLFEEMMLQAGLFDRHPRARELIYILLANRAARAIADLKMQSNEFTLEEAVDFAVRWTPKGWLLPEGDTVWTDMRIYLHQPGYGASYVVGKAQIDGLLAERARELGDRFTLEDFMDTFLSSGMIPVSLIRWEMTGLDDEVKSLTRD